MGERGAIRAIALQWLLGGVGLALAAAPLCAQEPSPNPGELDPSAPLDPMPDLGVEWPDMNQPEPAPPPEVEGVTPEAAQQSTEETAERVEDIAATRPYRWTITGIESLPDAEAIQAGFDARSALEGDNDKAANAAQIDRRARADAELLAELLRAQGYYDALVEPTIEVAGTALTVQLTATPGPIYRFESVELPGLEEAAGGEAGALREAFAVKAGDPVVAQNVIGAGVGLQVALGERGFATAKVGEQDIVIDHEAQTARLVLPVTPGPIAVFGQISVSGEPAFSSKHVQLIARFKPGDRYEADEVMDLKRALIATGLVAFGEVRQVPRDGGKVIDLAVKLEPAPMRTIAGELGYGTGEGIRAEASWQHRNLFNPEGALTVRGVLGTQEQLGAVTFRRNNWLRRDQVLNAQALAAHIDRDAYEAKTLSLSAGFERQSNFIWQKRWTWSLGAELVATDEEDTIEATGEPRRRTFFIAAIPGSLGLDETDDLLDPTKGFRLLGRLSPEISFQGGTFPYARTQIDASTYHRVSQSVVAAGRVRVGSILGANRDDIAPSRRFYSGGGGSVRGYGYQRIGPRDVDNDPIGGRSLAEFSLEARVRLKAFGGNFGVVPFIDGGTLSTEALPDFKDWQIGVGIGARYYSSFGPIRLDIGTPLNRQKGDGRIAVVVGLGQAF
ncbi:BamA/TamA family outer membrane protein [Sphingomonas sp. NSE70-1]|uniref:BamA/TamA family outer membrane protein n=1 Tax=Sphingomonas caseinilyticus TaxID=2908205 RepID=A0ABT0RRE8_9SPHN|nr:BamA/TamA family outer membrane protein [Sphingomonas caseinilyticus]MCL6697245.1 BamA/TamA family outer membrane protein [Sphingomonas caseinilyticus]